jgi:hypothetical protein
VTDVRILQTSGGERERDSEVSALRVSMYLHTGGSSQVAQSPFAFFFPRLHSFKTSGGERKRDSPVKFAEVSAFRVAAVFLVALHSTIHFPADVGAWAVWHQHSGP